MKNRSLFWWLIAVSFTLAGTGLIGLITTMSIFAQPNLLLYLFGAFWLFGAPLLLGVSIAWSVKRIRGITANRAKGAGVKREPNGPPLLRAAAGIIAVLFGGSLLLQLGGLLRFGANTVFSTLWTLVLMLVFGSYALRGRKAGEARLAQLSSFLGLGSGSPSSGSDHRNATVTDPLVIPAPQMGQGETPLEPEATGPRYYSYPEGNLLGPGAGCIVFLLITPGFAYFFVTVPGLGWGLALLLGGLVGALVAGLLIFRSITTHRPFCKACGKRVKIKERMIGLPVTVDVLRDPLNAEVLKSVVNTDYSPLEVAEPYRSAEEWISQPTLFFSLGRCENCDGPFIMLVEAHGLDEVRNELHFESILHREVERESANKLIEIARKKGLMTYGQH
jgi:hypothetical protein